MVTHDRYFLDRVCNRIVEINKGKLYSYNSNYEGYLELKAHIQRYEALQDEQELEEKLERYVYLEEKAELIKIPILS